MYFQVSTCIHLVFKNDRCFSPYTLSEIEELPTASFGNQKIHSLKRVTPRSNASGLSFLFQIYGRSTREEGVSTRGAYCLGG